MHDGRSYPGGKLVLSTGLLDSCNSDATIAAIIGHEVGHAIARHVAEIFSRFPVLKIFKLFLYWSMNLHLVPAMSKFLTMLPYSRNKVCRLRCPTILKLFLYWKTNLSLIPAISKFLIRLPYSRSLTSHGINAEDVKKLHDAGIYTCSDLIMHTKKSLTGIEGLSEAKVDKFCEVVEKTVVSSIPTGCKLCILEASTQGGGTHRETRCRRRNRTLPKTKETAGTRREREGEVGTTQEHAAPAVLKPPILAPPEVKKPPTLVPAPAKAVDQAPANKAAGTAAPAGPWFPSSMGSIVVD
ncbi:Meiotic recombination protein dmc1 [Orobanche hederae]